MRYIVINIGCFECGANHEIVGKYHSKEEAEIKARQQPDWRQGGQSGAYIIDTEALTIE